MPKTNYNDSSFWQQKYKVTICEAYQWICKPEHAFKAVSSHIDYENISKVLEIGCGTSSLAIKLKRQVQARQGNIEMTCVDFSKQLIRKCREGKVGLLGAEYICADVRDMKSIEAQQFDLIIDKGTIDCLFCNDNFIKEILKGMRECYRVLKEGGKMIILTHAKPKLRKYLFRNKLVPFKVEIQVLKQTQDRPTQVYAYICTKGQASNANASEDGKVLSQHQHSQHEQQEQKQNQNKDEQEKSKQQPGMFILDQPEKNSKKKKGKKSANKEPHFILSQEQNGNKQDSNQESNQKVSKKQKKKKDNEPHFILSEQENKENQQDENHSQNNENQNESQQQNQQKQNEDGDGEENEENSNQQNKHQAQYENDFD